MLIELSKDQIEYLVKIFEDCEDCLNDFEAELFDTLAMALTDGDDVVYEDVF